MTFGLGGYMDSGLFAAGNSPQYYPDDASRLTYPQYENRENYADLDESNVFVTAEAPVSTFSIDVDTGSYANVRRMLEDGYLPPQDAVRAEELLNYFTYDDPVPTNREVPFTVSTELGETPWNEDTHLLRIGIRGYDVAVEERPAANLVFLIDVSGSMNSPDKLPLLVQGMKLLTRTLREDDTVSIVVYAGSSGVVLEPTPGDERRTIERALERLSAGGSTAGGAGINLAYALAEKSFIEDGINRVILATDGDFNVGVSETETLTEIIEEKREAGITLTTLGFGTGNYNDELMEQLADVGNGNYAYIDSLHEARRTLVTGVTGTLFTIAKDVKIQIEFNPAVVAEYRLIGYENRALEREDFNNDSVDAGDIGAGHSVVALYELTLVGSPARLVDDLHFNEGIAGDEPDFEQDFAFLRLRYKQPDADDSALIETALPASQFQEIGEPSGDLAYASAVAAFAQRLSGGAYVNDFAYEDILGLARQGRGEDPENERGEFIELVQLAQALDDQN